ncbi:hypothetical protein L6R53_27305, partial [Myxococcota bacterium]|nr:hypothetical protein [Myxococcota bacterium]
PPPTGARAASVSAPSPSAAAPASHPAPTPVHPVPVPVAPAAPSAADGADDEPLPPRRGNGVVIGVAVAMVALALVCGAGGFALHKMRGAATEALSAGIEAATTAEAPAAEDPAAEDPAAEDPAAEDPAAEDPAAEVGEGLAALEPPVVEAVEPDPPAAAPDPPAAAPEPPVATRAPDPTPVAAPVPTRTSAPAATRDEPATRSSSSSTSAARSSARAEAPPPASSRTRATAPVDEPVADLGEVEEPLATGRTDIERYAAPAAKGSLTASDVMALETVQLEDGSYTRARALLLMNAQRKGDDAATKRYLDQLMLLPENQYNPIYLSDLGRYHVNRKQYETALEKATLAERYWARLPPELVFSKKAEIYETQAAAWQGRFYKSGTDMEMLEQAIRHWQKYRDHVETRSRSDLARKAEAELAKLEDIKRRLQ